MNEVTAIVVEVTNPQTMILTVSRFCIAMAAVTSLALSSCFSYHRGTGQVVEELQSIDVEDGPGKSLNDE